MLFGIPEQAQPLLEGLLIASADTVGGRKLVEQDPLALEPLTIGMLSRDGVFELVVVDDAPLLKIDEKHAPGLKTPLEFHFLGRDVENSDLTGHDHHVVVGDVVAARSQAIAVEQCTHDRAVCKGDRCRSIPGLHRAAHVLVDVPSGARHLTVILPRLRHHHHDRLGELSAGEQQELERIVEVSAVGAVGLHDRERTSQIIAEELALECAFAGIHFVHVAAQGIDLAVVAHETKRLRAVPARECIGGEARVHHSDVGFVVGVAEIGIKREELLGRQHTLVHEYARGEAADVEHAFGVMGFTAQPFRRPFSDDKQLAIKVSRIIDGCRDKDLLQCRLRGLRRGPYHAIVTGHRPPSEKGLPFLGHHLLECTLTCSPFSKVTGQKYHAGGVASPRGQVYCEVPFQDFFEESVRKGRKNAGTVAGIFLATDGAAMGHVDEDRFRLLDDLVSGPTLYVSDKAYTA